ncbi:hypothetical protein AB2L27_16325 [Kineococcus sp. LSe6-4]|uniref:Uncharacterized protein n=1 Tax=Kineococcus halophytocola TaxID=3234027 RepID=A0ABV4H434_9ACTN
MRRLLAWFLLVVGLACGLTGAALLTVLAPPERIDVVERVQDPGVAVVTRPGLAELSGPDVRLRAEAPDGADVFVAVARADDADAWLDGARHTEVTAVTGELSEPRARTGTTGTGAAADPRRADVWLTSTTGRGSAELTWPTGADDDYRDGGGIVLFTATDGVAAAPGTVRLSWHAEGRAATHPAGTPLAVAGGVLVLLGGLGVLLSPRPARRPRSRRRA